MAHGVQFVDQIYRANLSTWTFYRPLNGLRRDSATEYSEGTLLGVRGRTEAH